MSRIGDIQTADSIDTSSELGPGQSISTVLDPNEYPDIQDGRFLQLGHKVMHNYNRENTGEVADSRPPYAPFTLPPPIPSSPPVPSPAMAVALVALFVAMGGASYAAVNLSKNSVGTVQLRNRGPGRRARLPAIAG